MFMDCKTSCDGRNDPELYGVEALGSKSGTAMDDGFDGPASR